MKPRLPALELELVADVLVRFVRDATSKFGFDRAVVGVSGGIDSSVSAAIAARALGPKNVLGLLLPYKTSSPESEKLGRLVCETFALRSEKIDVTPMVDGYLRAAGLSPDRARDRVRSGNVMARARMIAIFDHSARERALVIGTSDKTELLLGYTTWHGDSASSINPIGDLYKTQVYALARHLGVPEAVCKRAPTPDFFPGQTAEGDMGLRYEEVDALLHDLVDRRLHEPELLERGWRQTLIRSVVERVRASQYKRRVPVIAKVSARTVNLDFRYLRDWGR
ncbi:MAG TPA: NAD+ synthase [Planctomycetota bacterium]|nr:NAD+ synthase [Planctomycetota bacterium]